MMKFTTKQTGDKGEDYAAKYLKKNKYKIIKRNYSKPYGEIDIIAEQNEYIVFVEVKTRRANALAEPSYAVNYKKQEHIRNTAQAYLDENNLDRPCRFDVCEVYINSDNLKLLSINYIEDAF